MLESIQDRADTRSYLQPIRATRRATKNVVVAACCLITAIPLLDGCSDANSTSQQPDRPPEPTRPVRVETVTFESGMQRLILAATVAPRYETTMAFRVGGKISVRTVNVGDKVKATDVVARLDEDDLRLAVRSADAQLAGANADYQRFQADVERYEKLRGGSAYTQQTYEARLAQALTAEERVKAAQSQLEIARNALSYATMTADQPGVVTALLAEAGQVVALGQPVMRIARTAELEIVADVPENRIGDLAPGAQCSFTLWAAPGHSYPVRLRELSPSANPVTRTYAARFSVVEEPPVFLMGMSATLSIEHGTRTPVAQLPATAVFQSESGAPAVWVVDPVSDKLALKAVTVRRWKDGAVEISSGVEPGALVVTAGAHRLDANLHVRPVFPRKPTS
jgi:multidrug efflux system membrane fusion protein